MMFEVIVYVIFLVNQYGVMVFGICCFVMIQYCWFFFIVRNDGDLIGRNIFVLQIYFNGVSMMFIQSDVVFWCIVFICVIFYSYFVGWVVVQEVSVCVQYSSEVRMDIVFVEIEVNDVVLLQLLYLQMSLFFRRYVVVVIVSVYISVGIQYVFIVLVVVGVFVRRICCDCYNWQSDYQFFQYFVQLYFFDFFNN